MATVYAYSVPVFLLSYRSTVKHPWFSIPPVHLSPEMQQQWLARVQTAERIVGVVDGGVPAATEETLALLDRYVRGELTLEQVTTLQQQRLGRRS